MNKADKCYMIGKRFVDDKDFICLKDRTYHFNGKIWEEEEMQQMETLISREYFVANLGPPTRNDINEVLLHMRTCTYDLYGKISIIKNTNCLYLKNGVLDLDKMELRDYLKEDFAFHQLPFDFKEKVVKPNCPTLKKFLCSSMGFSEDTDKMNEKDLKEYTDIMLFIQEWMGYTLEPGNKLEKSLIMVGDGRNGKGVLQFIWAKLLGEENVSYVDLPGINNRQEIIMCKNKLANFSPDLEYGQQLDTGVVKKAISGETVVANEKYRTPEEFEFTAKIIIACNTLPFIKKVSSAVTERFHILPFNIIFREKTRDINLKQKLMKEIEDIFIWALNGLKRLRERGYFIIPQRCKDKMAQFCKSNDTLEEWLEGDDNIKRGETFIYARGEAFSDYKSYTLHAGRKPINKAKFFEEMIKKGFKEVRRSNGRFYEGLKYEY